MMTQIVSKPHSVGQEGVEVKDNRVCMWTRDLDELRFPTVGSIPQKVEITDVARTWPVYVELIGGAPLKRP